MKLLRILFVCGCAKGTKNKGLTHSDSDKPQNIMTEDFTADPVRDMRIDMLNIQVDHAPGEKYYLLVLKVAEALKTGYIKRNYDTKHKGAKGMYTELYNVVENHDQVLLPCVDDLSKAKAYFKIENNDNSDENTPTDHYPQEHSNNNHRQYTEDEKEDIIQHMIEEQDKERSRSTNRETSEKHNSRRSSSLDKRRVSNDQDSRLINDEADSYIQGERRQSDLESRVDNPTSKNKRTGNRKYDSYDDNGEK